MRRLALFDLDHTLIPFDSGMAWTRFLVREGALDEGAEARYLGFCHQYVAGTLDIHAMVRANLGPLAAFEPQQLARGACGSSTRSQRNCLTTRCGRGSHAISTAATCAPSSPRRSAFVAEPFARAFGIEHLVATEGVMVNGRPTGEIDGLPCFREHKLTRVQQWLTGLRAAPTPSPPSTNRSSIPTRSTTCCCSKR